MAPLHMEPVRSREGLRSTSLSVKRVSSPTGCCFRYFAPGTLLLYEEDWSARENGPQSSANSRTSPNLKLRQSRPTTAIRIFRLPSLR